MRRRTRSLILATPLTVAVAALVVPLVASSSAGADGPHARTYHVALDALNDSGAAAVVNLRLVGDRLTVNLEAHGLLPMEMHMQHLHWTASATHTCPPASAAGSDGILTVGEGLPFYGAVDVPLTLSGASDYPMADMSGTIHYQRTFTLTADQLAHVSDWVVVEHGLDVDGDGHLTGAEVSDPVTCGEVGDAHGA